MTARPAAAPVKITLLGLDRSSASIGLALSNREGIKLTGFDRDHETARLALSRRIFHETKWDLREAAAGADLILLSGPLAVQRESLQALAAELREGSVLASLSTVLTPPLAWAAALPAGRHFVAVHPILNPAWLHNGEVDLEAARPDLFAQGLWALAVQPAAAPEALKLLSDLATLVGAQPYFVDAAEHDGLAGALEALPALLAAALLRAATASPGWGEMRKVADRDFATATFAIRQADPDALSLNRANTLRYLEAALAELQTLRDQLAREEDSRLARVLADAAEQRARWVAERQRGEWDLAGQPRLEMPTFSETLGRILTGGLFRKRDSS